jgi:hypothetical protein
MGRHVSRPGADELFRRTDLRTLNSALPVTHSELNAAALTIALVEFDAQGAASGLVEQLRAE